ncbi:hypothetical protein EV361DRAFT_1003419 [Lentinula raphanica]|uniref:Uncharacterized protein n=1 Tax=Lentinula raphanica TaxID=153919 RepID=A0AA38PG56_9AGAR|nr:hypothetical protein F5878DRAFT_607941 [Lentinula raphanica]KAJ3968501.1 hypothetical protein EV361DRAFT_1003419 [Lentinula raphanica]
MSNHFLQLEPNQAPVPTSVFPNVVDGVYQGPFADGWEIGRFSVCPHTCPHPTIRRVSTTFRKVYIWPTNSGGRSSDHVKNAKSHSHCTSDCPGFGKLSTGQKGKDPSAPVAGRRLASLAETARGVIEWSLIYHNHRDDLNTKEREWVRNVELGKELQNPQLRALWNAAPSLPTLFPSDYSNFGIGPDPKHLQFQDIPTHISQAMRDFDYNAAIKGEPAMPGSFIPGPGPVLCGYNGVGAPSPQPLEHSSSVTTPVSSHPLQVPQVQPSSSSRKVVLGDQSHTFDDTPGAGPSRTQFAASSSQSVLGAPAPPSPPDHELVIAEPSHASKDTPGVGPRRTLHRVRAPIRNTPSAGRGRPHYASGPSRSVHIHCSSSPPPYPKRKPVASSEVTKHEPHVCSKPSLRERSPESLTLPPKVRIVSHRWKPRSSNRSLRITPGFSRAEDTQDDDAQIGDAQVGDAQAYDVQAHDAQADNAQVGILKPQADVLQQRVIQEPSHSA